MELRDLIVTPIIIFLVYAGAYWIRPRVTDSINRRYFIPALTVRIIGALAVGFLYQFYYGGGDTFNYHTHGSRIIWEAFWDSPLKGAKLLFANGQMESSIYEYSSKIWYFRDQQSYFLICITTLFDLITFSSYSATSVFFALLGFSGSWVLFRTFYKIFPDFHRWIAFSCLFIPTVCFWGSGIFKDTVTLAALGWITYSFYEAFLERKSVIRNFVIFVFSFWVIYSLKKYILLSILPSLILWYFLTNLSRVKSTMAKALLIPVTIFTVVALGYFSILNVAENDKRYDIDRLAETAKITAYDIRFGWGARTGEGSGYTLGELDGTWQSMIRLAPAAINVSLFRPYLWEIRNPLMLLSGFESFLFLLITIVLFAKTKGKIFYYLVKPEVIFCLSFSVVFAFAVGVSTFNFGTLSRYKIPMEPFYLLGLGLAYNYSKKDKKMEAFDSIE